MQSSGAGNASEPLSNSAVDTSTAQTEHPNDARTSSRNSKRQLKNRTDKARLNHPETPAVGEGTSKNNRTRRPGKTLGEGRQGHGREGATNVIDVGDLQNGISALSIGADADDSAPSDPTTHSSSSKAGRRNGVAGQDDRHGGAQEGSDSANAKARGTGRRRQINTKLTEPSERPSASHRQGPRAAAPAAPKEDNLTSRLIHSLRTPPYPDCPICFSSIHPAQPIWCCSPNIAKSAFSVNDELESRDTQCCYTPFHLKCIRHWASKSVKDTWEAYRARGEDRSGEWRCPACQRRRDLVPQGYICFCGAVTDPRPARLATPHSCGNTCSRPRACGHACPLECHPGPCPPCHVTMQLSCYCTRQMKSFRCSDITARKANSGPISSMLPTGADLTCGRKCDKLLSCGRHQCQATCHPGDCASCPIVERSKCYCGKAEKNLSCGEGDEQSCAIEKDGRLQRWTGRFACEDPCGRYFDCGIHQCEKACHQSSIKPPPCLRSPSLVTHCPCGKKRLEELANGHRERCTDRISTCGSICMKPLEGCDHVCSVPCHTGSCPPCAIRIIVPCRCGSTARPTPCYDFTSSQSQTPLELFCDKPCTALRACGRHQCNRICCPFASLSAVTKGKGKKKGMTVGKAMVDEGIVDEAGWHECDLVCGKMLGCGNHRCEERDHRGMCPPCLRSSFEEMICACGRTIIEPPVPCGTRMSCTYPCALPSPPCGHPKTPHTCHDDSTPCPACPFLTQKLCTCGKTTINNVRCSQEKVSCGTKCGKVLGCGFHHCERLCHGDDCGSCTAVCGKPRKLCFPAYHGCVLPCHAPSACSEIEPCKAMITLKCLCGRIQQPSSCGRSLSNPAGREATQQLKCSNDCLVARRNARLAEALGISPETTKDRDHATNTTIYSVELVGFAKGNAKFCALVEKAFADFVGSEKKFQVLPYMPEARRKFVHDLATVYRIDTQMIDQEPRRSVQLIRRVDTRIPKPLLSDSAGPSNGLGKLADLRATPPSSRAPLNGSASKATGRGWTAVVSASSSSSQDHQNKTAQSTQLGWGAPGTASGASAWRSNLNRPLQVGAASNSSQQQPTSSIQSVGSVRPSRLVGLNAARVVNINDSPVPDDWERDEA